MRASANKSFLSSLPYVLLCAFFVFKLILVDRCLVHLMNEGSFQSLDINSPGYSRFNPRGRLPVTYRHASTCNGGSVGDQSLIHSKEPKVKKNDAIGYIREGYTKIQQGSYRVEMVGLMCMIISKIQHDNNIFGSVGEMGVHHGRFTGCIFITARSGEDLIVADVFEQQDKNVDGSGLGNKELFFQGTALYGINESAIHTVFTGSTDEIPFGWAKASNFHPFRFISVDAGHTARLTFNDLDLAFCNLARGGVVVVDDLFHDHWVGVTEGIMQYFMAGSEPNVFPFLICDNKLFMTNDRSMHSTLYNALLTNPETSGIFLDNAHTDFGGSKEFLLNNEKWLLCTDMKLTNGVSDILRIWEESVY